MFIHLDDQKHVGGKKEKKEKSMVGTIFVPAGPFPTCSFPSPRDCFWPDYYILAKPRARPHFSTTAAHRPNPTLFSSPSFLPSLPLSTTIVHRPNASFFSSPPMLTTVALVHHCCPHNPAIHLKVSPLSRRYCFWFSAKLFC
jgi:hypothetical protein